MVAILRIAKFVGQIPSKQRRRLILVFRVPGWITGETFVLSAGGMLIPTAGVPGVVGVANHLRYFAGGIIAGGILFAINCIMHTGGGVTAAGKRGNHGSVIAFH